MTELKRIDLKSSHDKEKNFVTMCDDDVNKIYYDDHLTMHTNIKLLYCIPVTNTMLYVYNISQFS